MKTTLLFAVLLVVALFGTIGLAAQAPPDAQLKRLEARLERLAATDLPVPDGLPFLHEREGGVAKCHFGGRI